MFPKQIRVSYVDDTSFHLKEGEFDGEKLSGWGRETIKEPNHNRRYSLGQFKDDCLNGVGVKYFGDYNKTFIEAGFYRNGALLDIEAFKLRANKKEMGEQYKDGHTFKSGTLYFEEDDEGNLDGLVYLECPTSKVHRPGALRFVEYFCYEKGKPVGISVAVCEREGYFNYDVQRYFEDPALYELFRMDWDYHLLEWEKITVGAGTKQIKQGAYSIRSSVILTIPSSVKKLRKKVFVYDYYHRGYFVEVFYQGTKREWEEIEKGEDELTYDDGGFFQSYYQNMGSYSGDRYEKIFRHWADGSSAILVHCLDGDVIDRNN